MIRIQNGGYEEGETPTCATSYVGATLATYERNGYTDSDFFAIVWDTESQTLRHIEYATTQGWTYNNGAIVDATPAVLEAAATHNEEQLYAHYLDRAAEAAAAPEVGRTVTVTRGRKIPHGTTGRIFWYGPDRYRPREYRVGLETADGDRYFTAAHNVTVQVPPIDTTGPRALAHSNRLHWRWS